MTGSSSEAPEPADGKRRLIRGEGLVAQISGEGCAQLDDFNWFFNKRAGDLPAPESEMEVSDSESEVEYIEPDSTPLQVKTTAEQFLCPPGGRSDETYGGL